MSDPIQNNLPVRAENYSVTGEPFKAVKGTDEGKIDATWFKTGGLGLPALLESVEGGTKNANQRGSTLDGVNLTIPRKPLVVSASNVVRESLTENLAVVGYQTISEIKIKEKTFTFGGVVRIIYASSVGSVVIRLDGTQVNTTNNSGTVDVTVTAGQKLEAFMYGANGRQTLTQYDICYDITTYADSDDLVAVGDYIKLDHYNYVDETSLYYEETNFTSGTAPSYWRPTSFEIPVGNFRVRSLVRTTSSSEGNAFTYLGNQNAYRYFQALGSSNTEVVDDFDVLEGGLFGIGLSGNGSLYVYDFHVYSVHTAYGKHVVSSVTENGDNLDIVLSTDSGASTLTNVNATVIEGVAQVPATAVEVAKYKMTVPSTTVQETFNDTSGSAGAFTDGVAFSFRTLYGGELNTTFDFSIGDYNNDGQLLVKIDGVDTLTETQNNTSGSKDLNLTVGEDSLVEIGVRNIDNDFTVVMNFTSIEIKYEKEKIEVKEINKIVT